VRCVLLYLRRTRYKQAPGVEDSADSGARIADSHTGGIPLQFLNPNAINAVRKSMVETGNLEKTGRAGLRNSLGQLLAPARGFPRRSGSLFGSTASDSPEKAALSPSEMAMGLLTQQPTWQTQATPALGYRGGLFFGTETGGQ